MAVTSPDPTSPKRPDLEHVPPPGTYLPRPAQPPARKLLFFLAVVLAVLGAVAATLVYVGKVGPFAPAPAGNAERQVKIDTCHKAILDRLRSPSTAKFSGETLDDFNILRVSVDSQNGFGAMVRTDVDCALHKEGSDWIPVLTVRQRS